MKNYRLKWSIDPEKPDPSLTTYQLRLFPTWNRPDVAIDWASGRIPANTATATF